ncbi:uncharacterized protein TRUGW13939_00786 [Talaromyces rugulosus]|uniref:Uncharacterized protein n=1 Tax=Talaromyces rugulosus TaxID=121627 RepID=A0A7H8QIH6_TALRU|nr:uncharacterized protein TRUGW13939_00786 [Talaromyces rugulosus]QKX53706.1 hypothetical protein TRUGW13939_00786 [Talaromyces rugulosus]
MSGNIFKWRRRRQLSSDMDSRFGDVSISSPNEGSWNEMAHMQTTHSQPPETNKASRLKALFRSNAAEQPVYTNAVQQPAPVVRPEKPEIQVPHHPMVDIEAHKRSMSAEGRRGSGGRRNGSGQTLVNTGSPRSIGDVLDSSSSCSCDGDDEEEDERKIRRPPRQRSQSQDSSSQHHTSRAARQHRSPPLSSTAVMRRYSSQSAAQSSVTNSTPSTATFSSRHTSMTSAASHGHHQRSIPPRLQEEIPPVPTMIPSFSSTRWAKKSRAKGSTKRATGSSIGPQELVPSHDELWGY